MKCIQHILVFVLLLTANMSFAQDQFPYHESFESGLGGWVTGSPSDRSWTRQSGPTSSWETGPFEAHDQEYYIYTEASGSNPFNYTLLIERQFDISSLTAPALSFYYHMYGEYMGTLSVEVNNGSGWETKWTMSGERHSNYDTPWTRADVNLSAYVGATNLMIRFRGFTGNSFQSDMCVDDIWIFNSAVIPDHFVWSPIPERQFSEQAIPVQITAVNNQGQTLATFNEAVNISGWSEGFPESVSNGDFESGALPPWTTMDVGVTPGPYHVVDSRLDYGKAVKFQPDLGQDGISQDLFMREGETYYISATYTVENTTGVAFTDSIYARIRINGTEIDGINILSGLLADDWGWITLGGIFIPPADGTYTLELISYTTTAQSPFLFSYFENVSVSFSPAQYINPTPALSGQFTNGVWTGSVTIDERVPGIHLYARYVDIIGESGIFTTYTSATDQDGDGMRDDWEELYFPSYAACLPTMDDDDDGYINSDEYIIGSNPMQKSSHLELTAAVTNGSNQCIINWFSAENRRYDIQWTSNLRFYPFTDLATEISYPQGAFTNNISGDNTGFYRMKVRY